MRGVHSMIYKFFNSHYSRNQRSTIYFFHIPSYNLYLKASKRRARVLLLTHNVKLELIPGPPRKRDCRDLQHAVTGEKRRKSKKPEFSIHTDVYGRLRSGLRPSERNCIRNFNIAHIIFQP